MTAGCQVSTSLSGMPEQLCSTFHNRLLSQHEGISMKAAAEGGKQVARSGVNSPDLAAMQLLSKLVPEVWSTHL